MAGKITIQLPMKMVQYKGCVNVLSVHRKQVITRKKNAMDTPTPERYDQLYKAVCAGETESIFKCLEKIESAKVRTRIISLIFDDTCLYQLAQCATTYNLDRASARASFTALFSICGLR
ncbi:hypothetical protein FNH22_12895 [Fulvivirga sp. M361]|uniref:hypothetical protein n=1 Tax=Fulvivirga sp. M361 TaxID=2594266 RepID=UPI00117AF35C|nr:hypothetical protein [Fulvivirga sp. M361]TRX58768.1 hypothetical protein FNH22_12895 [Fulvivirga sp. M361]